MWKPKTRKVQTPWPWLTNVSGTEAVDGGSKNISWGVCKRLDIFEWWQKPDSKSGQLWEGPGKVKELTGFSKVSCQFCAQCLHSAGLVNIMDMDSVMPGLYQAKVVHKYGQDGGSKGRRGMGKGWGDTKEEDSPPWRRVPLKVQIRTLLLDGILVFPCSECRWSSSYNLPEPHYPSPTGLLLLRGEVQNQWGVHGLSELTSRSWQGVLIS